jgi:hypothetical protein
MNNLKQYAGLLNEEAPENHFLAYITPGERDMLVQAGGVKTPTPSGIFAYPPEGNYGSSGTGSYDGGSTGMGVGGGENNPGGGDNSPAAGGSNYEGTSNNNNTPNYGDQEDDNDFSLNNNNPTGWSGDSGVDAYESSISPQDSLLGTPDYQGTYFKGGTYATADNLASRTLSYGDDAATEDLGRPDITYYSPTGTTMGDYKSSYELNQIKYIQDQKLKTVKNKLNKAGFEIDKDANFQETIDFVNNLSSEELAESYKDLKNPDGSPFYDAETIAKFEETGYIPKGGQMDLPGATGYLINKLDKKPLTRDELLFSLNEATEVGKTGGGAMDWQERMKTYSPNQYATMTGMDYNPRTGEFTMRSGGNEQDAVERVVAPYAVGGTAPQESMVNNYFANLNNTNLGISQDYLNTYNAAKTKMANTLNMTPPNQQYGYTNTYNDTYARQMNNSNVFYNYLNEQGLI